MAKVEKKSLLGKVGPAPAASVSPPNPHGKLAARNLAVTKMMAAKASAAKTIVAKGLMSTKKLG